MKAMSKDESETTPDVVIGPGTQLRRARERKGLDQAKMAAQLHLSQAMIVALENDDFDNLPGPVFVQGYLRKYARLLGVNEDAVVESYQSLLPVSEEPPIKRTAKKELGRELHSGYGIMRYVTWGILLSLVALVAYWWLTRVELEEPLPMQSQEEVGAARESLAVDQVAPQSLPAEAEQVSAGVSSQPLAEQTEPVLNEVDDVLATTDQLLAPADGGRTQSAETPPPAQVAPPPLEAVASQDSMLEEASVEVSKRVLFQFNEPCWTEVRDHEGKLRIFGEIGSGGERALDSRLGPFSILLGNAAGVTLTINGEPFDLKPFTRGKVARFTLDPARL
jgi:cytoskeleton protein RodZ